MKKFCFLQKPEKTACGLYYNTCVYKEVSYISCVSRKKDPVFRGKITLTSCVSRKFLEKPCFQKFRNVLRKGKFVRSVAISLERIVRVGVWALAVDFTGTPLF